MNGKKLVISAAAAGVFALGSIGFAAAQAADGTPAGTGARHGTMTGAGPMGGADHAARHAATGAAGVQDCDQHDTRHAAAAAALGITVAELDAALDSGKTMADIATEKGVDLDTIRTAMQGSRPANGGAGMGHGRGQPAN